MVLISVLISVDCVNLCVDCWFVSGLCWFCMLTVDLCVDCCVVLVYRGDKRGSTVQDSAPSLAACQQLSMLYASVSNQHYQMLLLRQKQREMLQMSSNSSTILRLVCSLRTTTSIWSSTGMLLKQLAFSHLLSSVPQAEAKCCRYWLPESIPISEFTTDYHINGLKSETPTYMAASEAVSTDINPVAWWKSHAMQLP